jgi:hypothetical protein
MTYQPRPIDTRNVVLSDDLLSLLERLAANNHDHWAAQRIAEGWTYGSERSDAKKEHPDLVAYAELPDSEKVYDRNSVKSTLEAILAFGYSITR